MMILISEMKDESFFEEKYNYKHTTDHRVYVDDV